jgi:hypothetical protein
MCSADKDEAEKECHPPNYAKYDKAPEKISQSPSHGGAKDALVEE